MHQRFLVLLDADLVLLDVSSIRGSVLLIGFPLDLLLVGVPLDLLLVRVPLNLLLASVPLDLGLNETCAELLLLVRVLDKLSLNELGLAGILLEGHVTFKVLVGTDGVQHHRGLVGVRGIWTTFDLFDFLVLLILDFLTHGLDDGWIDLKK